MAIREASTTRLITVGVRSRFALEWLACRLFGKLRLFAGASRHSKDHLYRRPAPGLAWHFHDTADARIVFGALVRAEPDFSYRKYRGTPTNTGAVSRILSVQVRGENVYVELKSGPGKLTPTGAVAPAGKAGVEPAWREFSFDL